MIIIAWILCMVFTVWQTLMGDYIQANIWNAAAIIIVVQGFVHERIIQEIRKLAIQPHMD